MPKRLLTATLLATVLIAARPGPEPVITVDGAAAAAKLSPQLKVALAPRLTALNAGLEKVAAAVKTSHTATVEERTRTHASLQGVHEECMKLYHEIAAQLDPEQRDAFVAYLHQQMKAAGIDPAQMHPGVIMKHGDHVPGGG
jgi:hypothetical protein